MYGVVAEVVAWLAGLACGAWAWARQEYRADVEAQDYPDPYRIFGDWCP